MGLEKKLKPSHRCCIPFLCRYFEHSFNVANTNCASKPWEAMSGRAKSVVASLLKPGNLLYLPAIATRSSTDHHRWSNLHRKTGTCNPQTPAEVAPITHICGSGNSSDNSIVSRILHIAVSFSDNTLTDHSSGHLGTSVNRVLLPSWCLRRLQREDEMQQLSQRLSEIKACHSGSVLRNSKSNSSSSTAQECL